MSDDLLERATRALSAQYSPEKASSHADIGSRRLARSLAAGRAFRARLQVGALVAAASFIGLTAWAAASGRLPRWLRPTNLDQVGSPVASFDGEVRTPAAGREVAPPVAPPAHSPTEETAPRPLPLPSVPTSHRRAMEIVANGQPVSSATSPSADLDALYRDAHDAHFVRRDAQAALAAWDRYIASAGANGRMTLEARYNRAIALVRLGRNDEAKAALEPFARGEFGGYRRDDAARLLGSLR